MWMVALEKINILKNSHLMFKNTKNIDIFLQPMIDTVALYVDDPQKK